MKRERKVTKDVFKAPKKFPTIRAAMKDTHGRKRLQMSPTFMQTFISPSQPHSKMH
jgi:hypothetical protein